MLVSSRNFGLKVNGRQTNAQVPLADMFNAAYVKNTHWYYNTDLQGFVVEASKDIKAGEQLFDTYGRKCNYRFFLYYAFIMLDEAGDNQDNTYPMWVDLYDTDPEYQIKKEVFLE